MRKIAFDDPDKDPRIDPNAWSAWTTKAKSHADAMLDWFEQAARGVATTQPELKDSIWKELKDLTFKPIFLGRCAYCEAKVSHVAYGDAEHYRPKNGVTEEDAAGKSHDVMVGSEKHPGYPWLAYDWQNLIPACTLCNNHKRCSFPVEGPRCPKPEPGRTTTAELNSYEKPLLLHPYFDDPAKHIQFDVHGFIVARKNDPRGAATIKVCALNREPLVEDRHEAQLNRWNAIIAKMSKEKLPLLDTLQEALKAPKTLEYSRAVEDYLFLRLEEELAALERQLANG